MGDPIQVPRSPSASSRGRDPDPIPFPRSPRAQEHAVSPPKGLYQAGDIMLQQSQLLEKQSRLLELLKSREARASRACTSTTVANDANCSAVDVNAAGAKTTCEATDDTAGTPVNSVNNETLPGLLSTVRESCQLLSTDDTAGTPVNCVNNETLPGLLSTVRESCQLLSTDDTAGTPDFSAGKQDSL